LTRRGFQFSVGGFPRANTVRPYTKQHKSNNAVRHGMTGTVSGVTAIKAMQMRNGT